MIAFLQSIPPWALPVVLIAINAGASVVYLAHRDGVMACYWAFAAGLNVCILLLKMRP